MILIKTILTFILWLIIIMFMRMIVIIFYEEELPFMATLNPIKKSLTCNTITNIAQRNSHPNWLIFGDLNLTTVNHEK